jgi:tRNA A37 threonylcarbamoyladenosine synthetase subunit TsaC/SUA5/YrdC
LGLRRGDAGDQTLKQRHDQKDGYEHYLNEIEERRAKLFHELWPGPRVVVLIKGGEAADNE